MGRRVEFANRDVQMFLMEMIWGREGEQGPGGSLSRAQGMFPFHLPVLNQLLPAPSTPKIKLCPKGRRMEAAEVGGRGALTTLSSLVTMRVGEKKKLQRLDHFNGVTYVNEVIAINSPLCGSLSEPGCVEIRRACPWSL